jgi:mRNA-degrading endonuclease toxin of MazEF toxin-antitoxin module
MAAFRAGQIVIADWRDALPKEPSKLRPAVVVEDEGLFDPTYPNVILVPLADDERLAITDLSVVIEPTPENGCPTRCWALAHCVATTSAARIRPTGSAITAEQLRAIRRRIALAIGLD